MGTLSLPESREGMLPGQKAAYHPYSSWHLLGEMMATAPAIQPREAGCSVRVPVVTTLIAECELPTVTTG